MYETKMRFSPRLNIRFWIVDHAFQSNPIKGSYKDQQQIRTLIILKSKKMQIWMFCLQLNFFVCITSEPVLPRSQPDSNLLYNNNKYANRTTICTSLCMTISAWNFTTSFFLPPVVNNKSRKKMISVQNQPLHTVTTISISITFHNGTRANYHDKYTCNVIWQTAHAHCVLLLLLHTYALLVRII